MSLYGSGLAASARIAWVAAAMAMTTAYFGRQLPSRHKTMANDGSMLGQRRRRWTNIELKLAVVLCLLGSHRDDGTMLAEA